MRKFLVRLAIFAAVFFLLDKAFIFFRNAGPELEVDKRLEKVITGKIDADLLIFGSSRGARSVIASQLGDSLGMSAFNLSYPGSDITFHEFLLREILTEKGNKRPKTVVLVVDDSDELQTAKHLKFRFDRMYPLTQYKVIRDEMVKRREKKYLVNELLVLHQVNKSNFLLEKQHFTKNDSLMDCGSMPIRHQKKAFDKQYKPQPYSYSREGELIQKIRALRAFAAMCKDNGIPLILAVTPNFRPLTKGFDKRMHDFVKDGTGTVFVFDEANPKYRDADYFFDNAHLRRNGAEVYTGELAEFCKNWKGFRK